MVSEFMLQQTPVHRVRPYYDYFLATWPTPSDFAAAAPDEVLRAWKGLGYPRRVQYLQRAAHVIVQRHGGEVPQRLEDLLALPGVGPYTARAIASFAFGARVGVLDTNVGRVFARALFGEPLSATVAQGVADQLAGTAHSAVLNQVLLDVGATYCRATPRCEQCPLATMCVWQRRGGDDPAPTSAAVSRPQARFEGSLRQLRGQVLAELHEGPRSEVALRRALNDERTATVLSALRAEGFIEKTGRSWRLAAGPRAH